MQCIAKVIFLQLKLFKNYPNIAKIESQSHDRGICYSALSNNRIFTGIYLPLILRWSRSYSVGTR